MESPETFIVGRQAGTKDELIRRAKAGEPGAMSRLLEAMSPRLERFASRLCGQASEDALQEALLSLSEKLPEFRDQADIYSWAYTLVRTACSRATRGLENAPKLPLSVALSVIDDEAHHPNPEATLLRQERSSALNCALLELDELERGAVLLRDVEGLSAAESARVLSISVPALKSRLHRGRRALSELLSGDIAPGRCPDVIALASRKCEGELAEADCKALAKHLETCDGCSKRCVEIRRLLDWYRRDGVKGRAVPADGAA